jgi:hypothetical protein
MSLFISKEEIIELTGSKQISKQREWLATHGYAFDIRVDGSIVMLRSHIEQKLNFLGHTYSRKTQPDAMALMKMMS